MWFFSINNISRLDNKHRMAKFKFRIENVDICRMFQGCRTLTIRKSWEFSVAKFAAELIRGAHEI